MGSSTGVGEAAGPQTPLKDIELLCKNQHFVETDLKKISECRSRQKTGKNGNCREQNHLRKKKFHVLRSTRFCRQWQGGYDSINLRTPELNFLFHLVPSAHYLFL